MRLDDLSLPHPVLGISDDVSGSFNVYAQYDLGSDVIKIKLESKLTNTTIEDLLKEKNASIVADINCASTVFRNTYTFEGDKLSVSIQADQLRDRVDLSFYVISTELINDYSPAGMNSDYGNNKFSLLHGDVIAYGGRGSFIADKQWADLRTVGSFMVIDVKNEKEGAVEYDLSKDFIIIKLSRNDYDKYREIKGFPNTSTIFLTSIVYPALIYSLMYVVNENDEFKGSKWYDHLSVMLEESDFSDIDLTDPENIPKIAQRLLLNPLGRTLLSVENIIDKLHEDEEA